MPKTAGTTFTSILKRQYFGKRSFNLTCNASLNKSRYQALSAKKKENIVLFTGHAPINCGIEEADNALIITILREPVSRVKSFCQHVAEGKSAYLIDRFPPSTFDLDEFLDSGTSELHNYQSRALLNHSDMEDPSYKHLSVTGATDMALDVLINRVAYFGLQEYFDESLVLFSAMLNWKLPIYASKNKKKNHNLLHFEERHLQKIVEMNEVDIALYSRARSHFLSVVASSSFDERKLKKLLLLNKLTAPVIHVEDKIIGLSGRIFGTTM